MTSGKAAVMVILLSMLGVVGTGGTAGADYFKYTDGSGTVCITNNLGNVPSKYRSTMKVIREETLARKDPGARSEVPLEIPSATALLAESPAAVLPDASTSVAGRLFSRFPWARPLAVVVAILAAFLVVRRISSCLSSLLLARVIYLSFFLGVFLFVYKSYAEQMSNSYVAIREKILVMFEKSARRGSVEPIDAGALPAASDQTRN